MLSVREPDDEEIQEVVEAIQLELELDDRQIWIWRNYLI